MGLSIAAVQNTLELWQQGLLNTANKVVEMGSQELHLKTADFEDMARRVPSISKLSKFLSLPPANSLPNIVRDINVTSKEK